MATYILKVRLKLLDAGQSLEPLHLYQYRQSSIVSGILISVVVAFISGAVIPVPRATPFLLPLSMYKRISAVCGASFSNAAASSASWS